MSSRRFRLSLLLLGALVAGGCQAAHQDAQPTFRSTRDMAKDQEGDRIRLRGEDPDSQGNVLDALSNFVDVLRGDTALAATVRMEDSHDADVRRVGIFRLVEYRFARKDPYVARYRQIGAFDTNALVRAAALRAVNRSRDKKAADVCIRAMGDADDLVRLEAAKALGNVPDTRAIPVLMQHLDKDESQDVRIACADALREFKDASVAQGLVSVLDEQDFAISWQAHRSLTLMTGRDFHFDSVAWREYFSGNKHPFLG